MTAEIIYQGNLRTEAKHIRSGSLLETDAPVDNLGKGERFSPSDLLAVSLASCILTTMGIKARDMNIDLAGAKTEVWKTMAADPRRIAEVKIKLYFPKNLKLEEKERTILERIAHTCPVARSVHPDLKQDVAFIWG
ncbi:MAG: OsmC family protein [Chitinophagaceae bacterium]|jgi:uncharacterized OsmC-like protein|nr:OsmC family protein [Chitinophagaceae bacterium]